MSREQIIEQKNYFYVIEGGLRQKVDQNHPEAVRRDWKSADGKTSGTKYERHIFALFGRIENIQFVPSDYGQKVEITLDENEEGKNPILSIATSSKEGEDFLKKLPNIDLSKEVRLLPYAFEDSGRKGLSITQQDANGEFNVKITDFFWDGEKNLNGYPVAEDRENMDKEDWKVFFIQARKFLVKYAEENILPKLETRPISVPPPKSLEEQLERQGMKYPAEDINPSEIPF